MPELPEVEVVRRGLEDHVLGRRIESVEVLHPRPVRRHLAGPEAFALELTGRTFTAALRRGKYLWLPLDSDPGDRYTALMAHLGMSGQMLIGDPAAEAQRHLRVRLRLEGDGGELRFVDQRMFGGLSLEAGSESDPGLPAAIAHIARDPLDPEFDDDEFVRRVRRSASGIKRLLLNQNVISGVGNIYADEALWLAKVHGERPGNRLSGAVVREVLARCREVMTAALAQGGTSFDALYVNVNGQSGYFERSLEAYGREGEPCSRCGTPIRRQSFMNRSSYFCPNCQKAPTAAKAAGCVAFGEAFSFRPPAALRPVAASGGGRLSQHGRPNTAHAYAPQLGDGSQRWSAAHVLERCPGGSGRIRGPGFAALAGPACRGRRGRTRLGPEEYRLGPRFPD